MVEFGHELQNDRWAIEAVFPNLRGGYFVEAGACGGAQRSASYVLEREFGWNGICVEPEDSYFRVLYAFWVADPAVNLPRQLALLLAVFLSSSYWLSHH